MAISTKNIKTKSNISKSILPGNVVAKLNKLKVSLSDKPKDPSVDEWTITMELETKPVGGEFVGFEKEFGDPSKGYMLGQSASVKSGTWPIKTFQPKKGGDPITDVEQILQFIQRLSTALGNEKWLESVDGKFDTIEELVTGFNKEKFWKEKFITWCIGGTLTKNDAGYPKYYLYLPEYKVCQTPFSAISSEVTKFDATDHVYKKDTMNDSAMNNDLIDNDDTDVSQDEDMFSLDDDDDATPFDMDEE